MKSQIVVVDCPVVAEGVAGSLQHHLSIPVTTFPAESIVELPSNSLALIELFLPAHRCGLSLARDLLQSRTDVTPILWAAHPHPLFLWASLEYRLPGFLNKAMPLAELLDWFSHALVNQAAWDGSLIRQARVWEEEVAAQLRHLPPHYWLLWEGILQGYSNRELANVLGWSRRTVERGLSDLYTALDVQSRAEAICIAVKWNLVRARGMELTWREVVLDLFLHRPGSRNGHGQRNGKLLANPV